MVLRIQRTPVVWGWMLERKQHCGGSIATCFQWGQVSEASLLSLPRFAPCGCSLQLSGLNVNLICILLFNTRNQRTHVASIFYSLFYVFSCLTLPYMIIFLTCHAMVFTVGPVCSFASIADVSICLTTQSAFSFRSDSHGVAMCHSIKNSTP